jgi:D-sedoheptulose 7-phosphate isomerase
VPTTDAFDEHVALVQASRGLLPPHLDRAAGMIADAIGAGGTCLAFGNGGSAADAQHFVAELVGHFRSPRPALAAIALVTDPAVLTSVANDLGYDEVFARQVEALARPGDVVLAISTSGRSPNVVKAASAARGRGCTVIGLTAGGGGALATECDVVIDVPSTDTQRVQEVHGLCLHAMVDEVERRLDGPR